MAYTTIDAIRKTAEIQDGVNSYSCVAQLSGIGGAHLHTEEFSQGVVCEIARAEPLSKEGPAQAVKVWFLLEDGDDLKVLEEYTSCRQTCT